MEIANTKTDFTFVVVYVIPVIRMIKSRRMKWAEHVARRGETRNAYRIMVGKQEGKRPPERQRRRSVDNIEIDLREIGWDDVVWTESICLRIRISGGLF
jgi:hypothetical protein